MLCWVSNSGFIVHWHYTIKTHKETHLSRCTVELLQAVFQSLHLGGQIFLLERQQVPIQLDLLQEGLGCGVVVSPLVGQVVFWGLVHANVYVGHEFTHWVLHLWLDQWKKCSSYMTYNYQNIARNVILLSRHSRFIFPWNTIHKLTAQRLANLVMFVMTSGTSELKKKKKNHTLHLLLNVLDDIETHYCGRRGAFV